MIEWRTSAGRGLGCGVSSGCVSLWVKRVLSGRGVLRACRDRNGVCGLRACRGAGAWHDPGCLWAVAMAVRWGGGGWWSSASQAFGLPSRAGTGSREAHSIFRATGGGGGGGGGWWAGPRVWWRSLGGGVVVGWVGVVLCGVGWFGSRGGFVGWWWVMGGWWCVGCCDWGGGGWVWRGVFDGWFVCWV